MSIVVHASESLAEKTLCQDLNVVPCSYCLRTKKNCSLNPHWAHVHQPRNGQGLTPVETGGLDDGRPQVKRQQCQQPENEYPGSIGPETISPDLDSLAQLFQTAPKSSDALCWDTPFAVPQTSPSMGSSNLEAGHGYQESAHLGGLVQLGSTVGAGNKHMDPISYGIFDCFMDPVMTGFTPEPSNSDTQSAISDISQVNPMRISSVSSMSSTWDGRKRKQSEGYTEREELRRLREDCDMSLSPFNIEHVVMANSNRNLISESLLRIYNDVLENNLSCWLAEDTCPYKMHRRPRELDSIQQISDSRVQSQPENRIESSNRMYRRVKQLDRAAQAAKLVRLTASEDRAASKALDLVVMAFATQWAQGSGRRERFQSEEDRFDNEFELALQQSVWDQARRALQDASDLECYRVVFAELIFGLIQKPRLSHEYGECPPVVRPGTRSQDQSVRLSILPQVMDIIDQGGPPVFMERAALKIRALKFRFEAHEAGFQGSGRIRSAACDEETLQGIGTEERQTLSFLYWLAVMFDTVSSSMNERPVVVSDEECQHDSAREMAGDCAKNLILSRRWELDLYAQDDSEKPSPLHWPCPYEAAARAVSKSATVKVLLFRHVSYFQNALNKAVHGQAIEEIIHIAVSVYRYWEKTHGAFFRDLTSDYESIPPRIKSWFPCIGIPWHLGCFMLADLIDFVDENGLGLSDSRMDRLDAKMTAEIRMTSAIDLANVAAATIPRNMGGMGVKQLPDFHFAVNESPLLTEPWTVLLIRALTKASIFHLGKAEELHKKRQYSSLGHESEGLQGSVAWAEFCIRALQCLGSKSGMAEAISKVLSQSLDLYRRVEADFLPSSYW